MKQYTKGHLSGHPIMGCLDEIRYDSLGFLERSFQEGDIVSFRIANRKVYGIHHPDLVKEVLLTHYETFVKEGVYKRVRPVFRKGLLSSTGELWKKQRRSIQPVFKRRNLETFFETIDKEICEFRDELLSRGGGPVDIFQEMLHLSLRVMASTMFGDDVSDRRQEISDEIYYLNTFMKKSAYDILPPMTWLPTKANRRYHKAMATLDGIIMELIQKREKAGHYGNDFLGMLLSSTDPETGERMSRNQIRDEAVVFFIAGHETTAAGLSWMYYLLDQNPAVRERVNEVVREVLPDSGSAFEIEHLSKFEYLESVFMESMRIFPPVYITYREANRDVELGGVQIKKGESVYLSPYLSNRDPRFWSQPETFNPDRFKAGEGQNKFVFYPFGAGPRTCIGNHFATMEVKMILARLSGVFDFQRVSDIPAIPEPLVTMKPKDPVMMKVVPR